MTKQDERKRRVLGFYEWLKGIEYEYISRDKMLEIYSFKTGMAVRTVREYFDLLESIGAITNVSDPEEHTRTDGTTFTMYRRRREIHPEALEV